MPTFLRKKLFPILGLTHYSKYSFNSKKKVHCSKVGNYLTPFVFIFFPLFQNKQKGGNNNREQKKRNLRLLSIKHKTETF